MIGLLAYLALLAAGAGAAVPRGARAVPERAAVAAAFVALRRAHSLMYAAFLEDPLTWALLGGGHGRWRCGPRVARAERRHEARRRSAVVAALAVAGAASPRCSSPTYPNYDAYFHLVWGRELHATA